MSVPTEGTPLTEETARKLIEAIEGIKELLQLGGPTLSGLDTIARSLAGSAATLHVAADQAERAASRMDAAGMGRGY